MRLSAAQIAKVLDGTVEGNPSVTVRSFSGIERAKQGQLSFYANSKYAKYLPDCKASVLLVPKDFEAVPEMTPVLIRVEDPYMALSQLLSHVSSLRRRYRAHRGWSIVALSASIGSKVWIGDFVTIGKKSKVGSRTRICENVTIGRDVTIGEECIIYPGVRIFPGTVIGDRVILHAGCIIGDDGFGNVRRADGSWQKIEHLGNVVIGNDVEIGSNCTIDRAPIESTVIEDGVRLDNLCHIGHGVRVGKNTAMAAQCGIAGSTVIGEGSLFAGQAGVNGHITIAPGTTVCGKSAVIGNVRKSGAVLYGNPAIDQKTYLKAYALFKKAATDEDA